MNDLNLSDSEKFLLGEICSMPDKSVSRSFLRHSARHLTNTGFRRVMDKMDRRSLVGFTGQHDVVTLTYKGLCAARALGWEE
jgi:hypothetical protein